MAEEPGKPGRPSHTDKIQQLERAHDVIVEQIANLSLTASETAGVNEETAARLALVETKIESLTGLVADAVERIEEVAERINAPIDVAALIAEQAEPDPVAYCEGCGSRLDAGHFEGPDGPCPYAETEDPAPVETAAA